MARVLLVDDDDGFATAAAELIGQQGHVVERAGSLAEARSALKPAPDFLLMDLMLPDGEGFELLDELPGENPTNVVVITANPSITSAVRAVRSPVADYLVKPFGGEELRACLERLTGAASAAGSPLRRRPGDSPAPRSGLIGESAAIKAIDAAIGKVAPLDVTVMISGESGTGKELIARAIHEQSRRRGPFVPVNCGAIAENLIASELFGHEKGSFTGAMRRHVGYFERAAGGTLFLDEITEMPLELQTHLLRVLETNRIMRVGGDREIEVDARLVAATNRDPERAVREGTLREDLYYRLMVFPIEVPPLRERAGDIRLLAQHFLAALNATHDTNRRLSRESLAWLEAQAWPGNVRELRHAIERAYILSPAEQATLELSGIRGDAARLETPSCPAAAVGASIRDMERALILSTLERYSGDKKQTAKTLGISLRTLYNRLESYRNGSGPPS